MKHHVAAVIAALSVLAAVQGAEARTDVNVVIGLPGLVAASPPPVVYVAPGPYGAPPVV